MSFGVGNLLASGVQKGFPRLDEMYVQYEYYLTPTHMGGGLQGVPKQPST